MRNLIENLEMMAAAFRMVPGADPQDGGVCWLPLYHDMGLVGCMFNGLYYPGTVTYIAPEDFIVQPALWLKTMSRYRAQGSPAPHFAYRLCYSKIKDHEMEGVDLSSWPVAFNGAEPIEVEGMRLFQERFAKWGFRAEAMTPVYGLAEAGLAVSFSNPCTPPRVTEFDRDWLATSSEAVPGPGRALPSVGKPLPGLQVQIRDENGGPLPSNAVGRIFVRGPSITPGFFNDPELTNASIQDGWLDTGFAIKESERDGAVLLRYIRRPPRGKASSFCKQRVHCVRSGGNLDRVNNISHCTSSYVAAISFEGIFPAYQRSSSNRFDTGRSLLSAESVRA